MSVGYGSLDDISEGDSVLSLSSSVDSEVSCTDLSTVASPDQENVLVVTDGSVDDWYMKWRDSAGELPADFGIISVGGFNRSAAAGATASSSSQARTQRPTTPGTSDEPKQIETLPEVDLSELGLLINSYIRSWEDTDRRLIVCFDCLDELIEEVGVKKAFKFLHLLVERLRVAGVISHFHLDPSVHELETINLFKNLFDITVE
ncbi:MAG: hypothetical protein SV377_05530 [Halobacteria archaeon]|nr:hypothetical protein [Halobacteria archaeon]